MLEFTTGNEIVDKMRMLNITGNVIPQIWYKVFNDKSLSKEASGKVRLLAINILADIVYWYRPTEVRDEKSGAVIGYNKKFKADLLQRSYDDLSEMFMCSKKDAQRAICFLEQFKVIKRVFRILNINGIKVANVLFLQLNVDVLASLTYPSVQNSPDPKTNVSRHKNQCVQTNTENTTYISSKTTPTKERKKVRGGEVDSVGRYIKERREDTYNDIIFDYVSRLHYQGEEKYEEGFKIELEQRLREYLQSRIANGDKITNASLRSLLDKLLKDSRGDIETQIKMVERSLAYGYKKIFYDNQILSEVREFRDVSECNESCYRPSPIDAL